MSGWREFVPGRRGKQVIGLAAAVLAIGAGAYLLLGQTTVGVADPSAAAGGAEGEGGTDGAGGEVTVYCGNAFAGGRRIEPEPTTATAPTTPTTAPATTGAGAPATTAPPATTTTTVDEEAREAQLTGGAAADCASSKQPRTIAGGVLLAVGLGALVILTNLLDTAGFRDE